MRSLLLLLMAASHPEARALHGRGDYPGCAAQYEALAAASHFTGGGDFFEAARCRALAKDAPAAFADLQASLAAGFDRSSVAEKEADLASLHADPRWTSFVDQLGSIKKQEEAVDLHRLEELTDADQADRADLRDWAKTGPLVAPRDRARRDEVAKLVQAGQLKTGRDFRRAALIFQHGETVADYREASRLAVEAVKRDPTNATARWLAAASEDRLRVKEGQLQKWGTQFELRGGADGGMPEAPDAIWVFRPVDPATTDAQRAEWNVPPLEESRARAGHQELLPR
jgi:hypothetical protein